VAEDEPNSIIGYVNYRADYDRVNTVDFEDRLLLKQFVSLHGGSPFR